MAYSEAREQQLKAYALKNDWRERASAIDCAADRHYWQEVVDSDGALIAYHCYECGEHEPTGDGLLVNGEEE